MTVKVNIDGKQHEFTDKQVENIIKAAKKVAVEHIKFHNTLSLNQLIDTLAEQDIIDLG